VISKAARFISHPAVTPGPEFEVHLTMKRLKIFSLLHSFSSLFHPSIFAMTDLTRRRYFGGIAALLGVVFIWVTSSFAMNVKVVLLSPILFTDTLLIGSLLE
jgi:uncharacterized PurR-regulated membrane protein YhhQ (DUF165 family)